MGNVLIAFQQEVAIQLHETGRLPPIVTLKDQRDWNWRHWDRHILHDETVLQEFTCNTSGARFRFFFSLFISSYFLISVFIIFPKQKPLYEFGEKTLFERLKGERI